MNEDLLNDALDALQQGKSIEEILERSPNDAEKLQPFLELAHQLHSLEAPEMPARWKTAEAHFLRAAAARRASADEVSKVPRRRLMTLLGAFLRRPLPVGLAFALLLLILGLGTMTVSADASPGTVLYPIKRANERVQLALTAESRRASLTIEYADRRRREIEQLLAAERIIPSSLVLDLTEQIEEAARLLDRSRHASAEEWQALVTLADQAAETLDRVARTESADPATVERAVQAVSSTGEHARPLAVPGEPFEPTATPQPAAIPPNPTAVREEPTPTSVPEETRPPEADRQESDRNEAASPPEPPNSETGRSGMAPTPADDRPPAATNPGRQGQEEAKPTPADAPRENQQGPGRGPDRRGEPPAIPPGRQAEPPGAESETPGPSPGRPEAPPGQDHSETPPGHGRPETPPGQEKEKAGPPSGSKDDPDQSNNSEGPPGNESGHSKKGPKKP